MTCRTKEGLYAMIRQLNAKFHLESMDNFLKKKKLVFEKRQFACDFKFEAIFKQILVFFG